MVSELKFILRRCMICIPRQILSYQLKAEPTYTIYMKSLYSVVLPHIRAGVGNDYQLSGILDTW
jgi:hypothetical protein